MELLRVNNELVDFEGRQVCGVAGGGHHALFISQFGTACLNILPVLLACSSSRSCSSRACCSSPFLSFLFFFCSSWSYCSFSFFSFFFAHPGLTALPLSQSTFTTKKQKNRNPKPYTLNPLPLFPSTLTTAEQTIAPQSVT